MSFIRNIIPFSIGIVQKLALWFYLLIIASRKSSIWSYYFSAIFSVAELYTKNLRFILGRFGGGYFGLKKYNTANEMDEAWETCPFFSNGDFFFSYENKAVCLNGAGKGSRKRKGFEGLGSFMRYDLPLFPVSSGFMMRCWSIITCDFAIVTARRVCFVMPMTSFCDVNDLMEMSNDLFTTIKNEHCVSEYIWI